ncbi:Hpt domain-containing protein [Roseovarius aquimarinus]|uniref:Hpt domain-containing protein n=1 Tax=Roseovarius aquimarinus TaxID=1229156 RepID=A0ABW7I8S1_9RHOB
MIDWSRVTELRDEIGAENFAEIVTLFLEEVETEIDALRAGCAEDALEARLHFLKGSALNLGFTDFSRLCQMGETAAASGRAGDVDLAATIACFEASREDFMRGLEALAPP